MHVKIDWAQFKDFVIARGVDVLMTEDANYYYLHANDKGFITDCTLDKNTSTPTDLNDFEANFKATCNIKKTDIENSEVVRVKFCSLGWKYWHYSFEFETSKLESLVSNQWGAPCSATSMNLLDASGVALTTQQDADSSCVVTQADWQAPVDLEILTGRLRQMITPTEDIHVFVRCAPSIPQAYGGQVDFFTNFNLRYLTSGQELIADGRASKYLKAIEGTDANKFRFELRHAAGLKHKVQITMEFFRA